MKLFRRTFHPYTPLIRSYMGDQVRIRVQAGAHEEEHTFTIDGITPDDDPREALRLLAERREQNLLLVTHQPLVGALAGLLVYGHLQQPLPFNTASLALLEGEMPLAGLMNLLAVHHPPSHC